MPTTITYNATSLIVDGCIAISVVLSGVLAVAHSLMVNNHSSFEFPRGKAVHPKELPAGAARTTRDVERSHRRVEETGNCSIGIQDGGGSASSCGAVAV